MNKQLKKYLSLMALTGALFSAGCSNNEQETSYYQEYTEAIKNGKTSEEAFREFTLKRADDERKEADSLRRNVSGISTTISVLFSFLLVAFWSKKEELSKIDNSIYLLYRALEKKDFGRSKQKERD